MKLSSINIISILSRAAGLSALLADATFQQSITTLAGPYATSILAVLGLISVIATDILHGLQLSQPKQ